jgi:thiol-disulfide isomerase/thioredoxin
MYRRDGIIQFIYAEDCEDCEKMMETIRQAMCDCNVVYPIVKIDSSKDEAVQMAIENNIDDLPACIIGKKSFCGKDGYTLDEIKKALETWA